VTGQARVLAVISLGGIAGALARYGIGRAFPAAPSGFPWATFGINVAGCLLIGVLMVFVSERWSARPLIRPFLGVGVLGGFTTFSTYTVDIVRLTDANATGTAVAYLVGTFVAAVVAVYLAGAATRWALRRGSAG
jgi:CrcB protein